VKREVKVPVSTLLAFIGGSDCDVDDLIAALVGREITEGDLESYLSDHFRNGSDDYSYARDVVQAWRQRYCTIPARFGRDYVASYGPVSTRVLASTPGEAREKAGKLLGMTGTKPGLLDVRLASERPK